jgi:hypothetical protein
MTKYSKRQFNNIFSEKEIKFLLEILDTIRSIFKKSTNIEPKLFLIGMKALYYYFGTEAFSPAPISLDIGVNFDILLDWTTYRKLIPAQIKEALESRGYKVIVELGLITIQKESFLIHLTTVIEYSQDIIGDHIPELNLDVGNKFFLIYTKLSRFDPYRDINRLVNLFKNQEIDEEEILKFSPELEKEIIKTRIKSLKKNRNEE